MIRLLGKLIFGVEVNINEFKPNPQNQNLNLTLNPLVSTTTVFLKLEEVQSVMVPLWWAGTPTDNQNEMR